MLKCVCASDVGMDDFGLRFWNGKEIRGFIPFKMECLVNSCVSMKGDKYDAVRINGFDRYSRDLRCTEWCVHGLSCSLLSNDFIKRFGTLNFTLGRK